MDNHQRNALAGTLKLLNPKVLKANLIVSSLYLAAYETLKDSIVTRLRGLFVRGWNESGDIVDSRYKEEVLAYHKDQMRASLLWFREMEAIDDADIELVNRLRSHRNELAHDLPEFLATNEKEINVELIVNIRELVAKIDVWWVRNFELPVEDETDGRLTENVEDDKIISGNMLFLHLLTQVAVGEEGESEKFYQDFLQTAAERFGSAS